MIKEVIVVEGRDDVTAVKRAVDAEVISVGGFGINAKVIERIREANKRQGVIIFTDPDFAGEKIRKIISKRIPGVKHAYIDKSEGFKKGDIGVENASPCSILEALKSAKCEIKESRQEFTIDDMTYFKLTGNEKSKDRRAYLGKVLRIGYCNTAQFIKRLNNYGISRKEFIDSVNNMEKVIDNGSK